MKTPQHPPSISGKRIRRDKLIGFRLDPSDYEALTRQLAGEAISVSNYMRRLIQADATRRRKKNSGSITRESVSPQ